MKTNAMRILDNKKIKYIIHDYKDSNMISGMDVANFLNEDPNKVFKTLVTVSKSKNNYVFLVPVNKKLDLKKAAKAVNEKNIEMIKSKELLPLTGYIHGGCSPIGMKKTFKTIIDSSVKSELMISGGIIGLQIEISLDDLKKVIQFNLKDIVK